MSKTIRRIARLLSVVTAVAIIAAAALLGSLAYFNAPPRGIPEPDSENGFLIFEIRPGESAHSVGRRFEDAGVIRNRHFWNLLARLSGEHIKAGTYRLELPASQIKIRSILVAGEQLLVRVTFPEGATLQRTAQILADAGICGAEDFIAAASSPEILAAFNIPGQTMEGYLFPDTYLFPLSYPAAKAAAAMAENFFRRLAVFAPESAAMTPAEINERVIMASIVEREYRLAEEAALMAGVFNNRLKIGMPLQSCATVVYVITEILGRPHPERIFNRDLEIQSPFNTYLWPGLPPGPISNPGETALRAAFNPEQTNYLYFRLINAADGRHFFSRTLDDHIMAGALFVKGR